MPESDPRPIRPHNAGPPPPAAGKSPDAGTPDPAKPETPASVQDALRAAQEPTPAENTKNIEQAIAALGASVEGLSVEVAQARRRAAKVERQLIMLCGVATYILWRVSKPELPRPKVSATDGFADAVSE